MKIQINYLVKLWNNLKLRPRLILINFTIIILTTGIITTVMLNYSKKIMSHNSTVLIQDSLSQINKNIEEMLNTQIYAVSKFIMYDNDIYQYLSRYNRDEYQYDRRKKAVDAYLMRDKIFKQYDFYDENLINIAAIVNDSNIIYNLSYPVNEERVIRESIDLPVDQGITDKSMEVKWLPLTKNFFTEGELQDIRLENVIIARRNIIRATLGIYIGEQLYTVCEKAFYNKYKDSEIIKDGTLLIIDKNGDLISHSDPHIVHSKNLEAQQDIIDHVLSNPKENYFITKDKKLVVQEPLNDEKWMTIAILPTDVIYKDINRIYFIFILLTVALLVIAGSAIIMTSNRIVQPIKKMIDSMEEVEKGNLDVQVNIKGQYEVSKLAEYYNNMILRIKKLIEEEYILEQKKKTAELDALQAQINPHFLYNTLESIVWKARAIGSEDISNMAYSLGEFFRISVNRGKTIVSIEEELNHVRVYVNIQKIRYGNKFDLDIVFEDDYLKYYKTLKLLLQPIVENAILYGIEKKEGKGNIIITVSEKLQHLVITIEDNGKGMGEMQLKVLVDKLHGKEVMKEDGVKRRNEKRRGIGLTNVDERIKLYFGGEYGLDIKSTLDQGTVVTVKVPLIE